MTVAVLDIDGVVADVTHRLHHIEQRPKDWGAFFRAARHDPALDQGVALARELAGRHEIVWLTGRPEWTRQITVAWLAEHVLEGGELLMRPTRDHRPARLFKLDMLRALAGRNVAAFVDDDAEVVAAALEAGLPAVLADWADRAERLREAQEREGRT